MNERFAQLRLLQLSVSSESNKIAFVFGISLIHSTVLMNIQKSCHMQVGEAAENCTETNSLVIAVSNQKSRMIM